MNYATQRDKILAYCAEHGSITIREAFEKLDINTPSKRISEMRNSPWYVVDDITEYIYTDEGKVKSRFKRYFIREVLTDG
jgi:hypothetical protein